MVASATTSKFASFCFEASVIECICLEIATLAAEHHSLSLQDIPVMGLAEMAGHDVREAQRTYARLNQRRKKREPALPKMSKKVAIRTKLDLFLDETDKSLTGVG